MALTTPQKTWSVGEVATAANLNTYLRDNSSWMATDRPHCRVFNSANISINSATATALTFDSERVDVGGLHSIVSTTSRITVPTGAAGFWMFGATVQFAVNATGSRMVDVLLNNTTIIARTWTTSMATDNTVVAVQGVYQLAVTDFIEVRAFQRSGGALNVENAANISPEFWALWLTT